MNAAEIEARIPHAGRMSLLERVIAWDEDRIHCRSATHRLADHPLRRDGRLAMVHLVEYAAQAVAVHSAVQEGSRDGPHSGVLAAVKELRLVKGALSDVDGVLDVRAWRELASAAGLIYRFEIGCDGYALAEGRVMIATGSRS